MPIRVVNSPDTAAHHRHIVRRRQIPDLYGVPVSSFDRMVREGILPHGFKLGPPPTRAVGWFQDDLDQAFTALSEVQG